MEMSLSGTVTIWAWIILVKFWPPLLAGLFLAVKRKSVQQKWMFFFACLGVCYAAQLFGGLIWQAVMYFTQKPVGAGRAAFLTMWALQVLIAAGALFFVARKFTGPTSTT